MRLVSCLAQMEASTLRSLILLRQIAHFSMQRRRTLPPPGTRLPTTGRLLLLVALGVALSTRQGTGRLLLGAAAENVGYEGERVCVRVVCVCVLVGSIDRLKRVVV